MKEEQLKIIETNQLYQFLANLDLGLLNIYSKNIYRFYNWIEEETIEDKEKVWERLTNYLQEDIYQDLKLYIGTNNIDMGYYYYKYSEGDFDEKMEEESFKADFVRSTIPVTFNKSDFEDIDKMYNSTQRYRRFEFEALGPKAELYSNTFNNHGFIFMIKMNIWLINIYRNTIDKIIGISKNTENQEESHKKVDELLSDINNKVLKEYEVLYDSLINGIYNDIAENLKNKENIENNQSENPKTIIVRKNPFYMGKNKNKKRMKYYN